MNCFPNERVNSSRLRADGDGEGTEGGGAGRGDPGLPQDPHAVRGGAQGTPETS